MSVADSTIVRASVHHPRAIRRQPGGANELTSGVTQCRITAARRRGKYLWLELDDGLQALVVHLGMSGQLRVVERADPDAHARVDFDLHDGRVLRFRDQRTFGWVLLDELAEVDGFRVPRSASHIALDPFDAGFQMAQVAERMRLAGATFPEKPEHQTTFATPGSPDLTATSRP